MTHTRYAIYYAPDPGPLADFGAAWLGWDIASGRAVAPPDIGPLPRPVEEITRTPRKYGLHATIKPPFRLIDGTRPVVWHVHAVDHHASSMPHEFPIRCRLASEDPCVGRHERTTTSPDEAPTTPEEQC